MKVQTIHQAAIATLIVFAVAPTVPADEIVIDGTHYADVYIRTTDSMYFVQTPLDGKVISIVRNDATDATVRISDDLQARAALLARWKENNPRHQADVREQQLITKIEARAASSELESAPRGIALSARGAGADSSSDEVDLRSNGYVPYIKLTDVPLATALDGILRPMGLDYKIYGNIVYVSTPEILEHEAHDPVQRRYYQIADNGTLPKIVLGGVGVSSGQQSLGGGGGSFGGSGGRGQGGFSGGNSFGGGGGGQFGGGGRGGQGGGGQGGIGGGGQGGQGGGQSVTTIGNISQLFTTIDDRMVGEAPAVIGNGYYFQD